MSGDIVCSTPQFLGVTGFGGSRCTCIALVLPSVWELARWQGGNIFSSCSHPILSFRDSTKFMRDAAYHDSFMSSDHTDYYSECSLKACIRWYTFFNPYLDLDSCPFPFCYLLDLLSSHPTPVQNVPHLVLLRLAAGSDTLGVLQLCSVPIPRSQVDEAMCSM